MSEDQERELRFLMWKEECRRHAERERCRFQLRMLHAIAPMVTVVMVSLPAWLGGRISTPPPPPPVVECDILSVTVPTTEGPMTADAEVNSRLREARYRSALAMRELREEWRRGVTVTTVIITFTILGAGYTEFTKSRRFALGANSVVVALCVAALIQGSGLLWNVTSKLHGERETLRRQVSLILLRSCHLPPGWPQN